MKVDHLPGCERMLSSHILIMLMKASGTLQHEVTVLPGCVDHFGASPAEECGKLSSDGSTHEVGCSPIRDCCFVQSLLKIADTASQDGVEA
jgi:hypothetical protein